MDKKKKLGPSQIIRAKDDKLPYTALDLVWIMGLVSIVHLSCPRRPYGNSWRRTEQILAMKVSDHQEASWELLVLRATEP